MGENLHKEEIEKYYRERLEKIYCSTRKNTIRSSQFIQELTPRIPSEIANLFKNFLLGLELSI